MFAVSATRTNQGAARIINERLRKQRLERQAEMHRREKAELEAKRREMERREEEKLREEQFQNYVIESYREVDLTGTSKLSVKDIVLGSIQGTGISYDDVLSPRRPRVVVDIRHYAMLCIWALRPDMSLPNIGRHSGGRDHTTILHAINRFEFQTREEAAEFIRTFGRDATLARLAKQAA